MGGRGARTGGGSALPAKVRLAPGGSAILVAAIGSRDMRSRPLVASQVPGESDYTHETTSGERKLRSRDWAEAILQGLKRGDFEAKEVAGAICFPMVDALVRHIESSGVRLGRIVLFGTEQDRSVGGFAALDSYATAKVVQEVYRCSRPDIRVDTRRLRGSPVDQDALARQFEEFFEKFFGSLPEDVGSVHVSAHGGTAPMKMLLPLAAQRWAGERLAEGRRVHLSLLQVTETGDADPCTASRVQDAPVGALLREDLLLRPLRGLLEGAAEGPAWRLLRDAAGSWKVLDEERLGRVEQAGEVALALLKSDFRGASEGLEAEVFNGVAAIQEIRGRARELREGRLLPKVLLQVHAVADRLRAGQVVEALARVYSLSENLAGALFEVVTREACTLDAVRGYVERSGLRAVWSYDPNGTAGGCAVSADKRRDLFNSRRSSAAVDGCNGLLSCWSAGLRPWWNRGSRRVQVEPRSCANCPMRQGGSELPRASPEKALWLQLFRTSPLVLLRNDSAAGHGFRPTGEEDIEAAIRRTREATYVDWPDGLTEAGEGFADEAKSCRGDLAAWVEAVTRGVLGTSPEDLEAWDVFERLAEIALNEIRDLGKPTGGGGGAP